MSFAKLACQLRRILRNAGVPAFVCAFACALGARSSHASSHDVEAPGSEAHYVGSETCRRCHLDEYAGWRKSRMANILLDPRQHPEAVVGDFAHPDPVRTFTLDDVAFTYGSRF